jgi:hypothetical protein
MLSSPDLGDIVDYATRSGVKVVMALDHQQLQAVENGGGASLITRTQGYVQLPEPVRFTEEWERSASLALREGKAAALADYAERGRIRAGTAEQILEGAAQAYVAHTLEGKDALLIARSHELRRELCRRVRGDLQHLGLVARDSPTIEIAGGQQASIGDLLVCTENDHWVDAGGVPLANKHVLRIEAITAHGPMVRRMLTPDPQTQSLMRKRVPARPVLLHPWAPEFFGVGQAGAAVQITVALMTVSTGIPRAISLPSGSRRPGRVAPSFRGGPRPSGGGSWRSGGSRIWRTSGSAARSSR